MNASWLELWRAHLPTSVASGTESREAHLEALHAGIARARTREELATVGDDELIVLAASHAESADPAEVPFETLHFLELRLARRCAAGEPAAIAEFERDYIPDGARAISRLRISASDRDEALQIFRTQTLVRSREAGPRIESYSGRGDLRAWVRISAVRCALKQLRGQKPTTGDPDEIFLVQHAAGEAADMVLLKQELREAFRDCFVEAFQELAPEERVLLRQHLQDGLSIDALAPIHHVHRATAARWLQKTKETLSSATRQKLVARGVIKQSELDKLLELAWTQLSLTLHSRAT